MAEDQRLEEEINRLYWGTERSVADIADSVGVSRRALYDAVRPRPAGVPCPACGKELTFRNRRGMERREAECPACGREHELRAEAAAASGDTSQGPRTARRRPDAAARPRPPAAAGTERSTLIGGAALIGLALGAVAALLLRRR